MFFTRILLIFAPSLGTILAFILISTSDKESFSNRIHRAVIRHFSFIGLPMMIRSASSSLRKSTGMESVHSFSRSLPPLILTIRVLLGFLKRLHRKDSLLSNSGMIMDALNLNIQRFDNCFLSLYPTPSVL